MATLSKDNPGLDKTGLARLWAKVKALVSKTATTTQNGLMTASDKKKLDGIKDVNLATIYIKAGQTADIALTMDTNLLIYGWDGSTGDVTDLVIAFPRSALFTQVVPIVKSGKLTFTYTKANTLTVSNGASTEIDIRVSKLAMMS